MCASPGSSSPTPHCLSCPLAFDVQSCLNCLPLCSPTPSQNPLSIYCALLRHPWGLYLPLHTHYQTVVLKDSEG